VSVSPALPRHRVAVAVELDERGLVDADREHEVGGRRRIWHREQVFLLVGETVGDGALLESRMRPRVRDGETSADPMPTANSSQ
jgi:hypothetical protein